MPTNPEDEREWQTRRRRVDPRLRSAGWAVTRVDGRSLAEAPPDQATVEYPTDNGPADYALWTDGKPLGVVEAKKLTVGPEGVLTQAERYSRGARFSPLDFDGFRVPFLYSTNGEVIFFHDVRNKRNRSRELAAFHSPGALQEMLSRDIDEELARLQQIPNDNPRLRDYQRDANVEIEKAIANRKREMLVAMATGTGKTYTMVNEVHWLLKSGVARRVLFLVDRRALAAQAVQEFASFDAEAGRKFTQIYEVYSQRFQLDDDDESRFDATVLPRRYLTDPDPAARFVYVCTIHHTGRATWHLRARSRVSPGGVGDSLTP